MIYSTIYSGERSDRLHLYEMTLIIHEEVDEEALRFLFIPAIQLP